MNRLAILGASLLALALAGCASLGGERGSFPYSEAQLQTATLSAPALDIQSWQTEQGSRVLFVHSDALPMLDVRLVLDAGAARDGDLPGLASLTSALISEGGAGLDVDQIARGFEDRGAQLSTSSFQDMGVISLRTLSAPDLRAPVLDLFTELLASPSFPEPALQRVRNQYLQSLQMQRQVPGPQVAEAFQEVLFAGHPYGHPTSGSLDSLPQIQRQQLVDFYQRYYAAGNAVIALVGDIERSDAEALAARISAALPAGDKAAPLARAEPHAQRQLRHIEFPSAQTHILLGNQSTWRGNPDHVALHVGNHILGGGGFASILTDEVRQKRGFVYGISSRFQPMAAGGPFRVQLQTGNDNADKALTLTLQLIADFVRDGPSEAQLAQAKANILGGFPLSLASNSDMIGQLGAIGFYDLPLDYLAQFYQQVQSVTVAQVREAMARSLDPEALAIVSIGPQAPQLTAAGEPLSTAAATTDKASDSE